jgi:hypothetical protein
MKPKLGRKMVISFLYPCANYCGIRPRLERRRLLVQEVRDVSRSPLDPVTLTREPQLRRGRWLVTGLDLMRGAERSFYLESMTDLICHSRRGAYCVAEVVPPKEVQVGRIVASKLSYAAAEAHVLACELQNEDASFVVLPTGWNEDADDPPQRITDPS